MMASSEFFRAWATATAILMERDVEDTKEAAVTTTGTAEDDGARGDVVENRPADKLLKVERGWVMLRTKHMIVRLMNVHSAHDPMKQWTRMPTRILLPGNNSNNITGR